MLLKWQITEQWYGIYFVFITKMEQNKNTLDVWYCRSL